MFPLNDYGVVCAALATFSAAVGYKYSQRQRQSHTQPLQQRARSASWASGSLRAARRYLPRRYSSVSSTSTATLVDGDSVDDCLSDTPSPSDFASDETELGSLKRKHRDEICDNSTSAGKVARHTSSPPPQKRCRSSSPEVKEEDVTFSEELHGVASPGLATPPPPTPEAIVAEVECPAPECVVPAPHATAPTPLSIPKTEPQQTVLASPVSPSKLQSTFTILACKPSTAFSAFASGSSAFSSAHITSDSQRPAWCAVETPPAAPISTTVIDADRAISSSLGTQKQVQHVVTPVSVGEEGEDIEAELKGVKFFVKRGSKEFTDGMLGHVKFLSNKETKEERLVFRREPVWKVSMSVRLRPIVRCTFDEEHGVLRLTLKEKNEDQDGESPNKCDESVVIYVFRRGKVSKSDFADFSKSVATSSRLVTSPLDRV